MGRKLLVKSAPQFAWIGFSPNLRTYTFYKVGTGPQVRAVRVHNSIYRANKNLSSTHLKASTVFIGVVTLYL